MNAQFCSTFLNNIHIKYELNAFKTSDFLVKKLKYNFIFINIRNDEMNFS